MPDISSPENFGLSPDDEGYDTLNRGLPTLDRPVTDYGEAGLAMSEAILSRRDRQITVANRWRFVKWAAPLGSLALAVNQARQGNIEGALSITSLGLGASSWAYTSEVRALRRVEQVPYPQNPQGN